MFIMKPEHSHTVIASEGHHTDGQQLTGKIIALLAGLSAIGILSTNIILPAFPDIGEQLGVSSRELGLTLSGFFITFDLALFVSLVKGLRGTGKRLVFKGGIQESPLQSPW